MNDYFYCFPVCAVNFQSFKIVIQLKCMCDKFVHFDFPACHILQCPVKAESLTRYPNILLLIVMDIVKP